jgi:hypothetical protein
MKYALHISLIIIFIFCSTSQSALSREIQEVEFTKVLQDNGIDLKVASELPHKNIQVRLLPIDTNIYSNNSQTYPPEDSKGVCQIIVIHPSSTRLAMIHQDSTIPNKYIRKFEGPDYTFMRVLLHEATHCNMYEDEGGLAFEILGDIFAAKQILMRSGGEQEVRILKYKRAVRSMLGEGVSHAIALSLDALEKNQTLPKPFAIELAHRALYQMMYDEQILDPDVHGYVYQPEGDLLRSVYTFMRVGLKEGRFDEDPLMKRSAQLYIEGLNYLAPALIETYNP